MPIHDRQEASDLDRNISGVLAAASADGLLQALRKVFAKRLDFAPNAGLVPLHAPGLPGGTTRITSQVASGYSA